MFVISRINNNINHIIMIIIIILGLSQRSENQIDKWYERKV